MNKAKKIVSEVFNLNIDDISDTSSIGQLPGWDSLGHMRLILKIEKIISRSIRTEEILSIVNIESIEKILEKNKK
ncbi:MAG: hypothetical protein CMG74_12970 [Candidatus Marinimicrobia bacterium]|nr:hypothetical protein [Candidatus Neomarinimicrobiota bacterium]